MANTNPHKALPELPEKSVLTPLNANITEINFARRVEILDNGCWLWHGSTSLATKGRPKRHALLWAGQGRLNGKMVYAHRYAYESRFEKLPDQRYYALEQTCHTELCVNPRHYELIHREVLAHASRPFLLASVKANPMCKNGLHERTPENTNTYPTKKGTRQTCRLCEKVSNKKANAKYKAKKKAESK
jgi:hypothetical protein